MSTWSVVNLVVGFPGERNLSNQRQIPFVATNKFQREKESESFIVIQLIDTLSSRY